MAVKRTFPPGPFSISAPFGGTWRHAAQLSFRPLPFLDSLQQYGELSHFQLFAIHAFVPNAPDLIREVLVTKRECFQKLPRDTRSVQQLLGRGILVTEGDEWLKQRRMVQPPFLPRHFDQHARIVAEETSRKVDQWTAGGTVDISDEMTDLTMRMAARSILGVRLEDEHRDLLGHARFLSEAFMSETRSIVRLPDWVPLPHQRRKRLGMSAFNQFLTRTIEQRRAAESSDNDVLSLLLRAVDEEDGGRFTDEQARDQAMTLFTAAFHANSMAMAWTFFLLERYPNVRDQLLKELADADRGAPFELADLQRLPYATMVIKESLRLYPPAWSLFTRRAIERVEIGGYVVQPGDWLMVFPYLLHHNPQLFPDPQNFDPTRFSPEREHEIPPYGYIPFGAGPRVCIGNAMTMMQTPLMLANILRRVRLRLVHPPEKTKIEVALAMRPRGGLPMVVEPRPVAAPRSDGWNPSPVVSMKSELDGSVSADQRH